MALASLREIAERAESENANLFFDSSTILVQHLLDISLESLSRNIEHYLHFVERPNTFTVSGFSKEFKDLMDYFGRATEGIYEESELKPVRKNLADLIKLARNKKYSPHESVGIIFHKPDDRVLYSELERESKSFRNSSGRPIDESYRQLLIAAYYGSINRDSASYIISSLEVVEHYFNVFHRNMLNSRQLTPKLSNVISQYGGLASHPVSVYIFSPERKKFEQRGTTSNETPAQAVYP